MGVSHDPAGIEQVCGYDGGVDDSERLYTPPLNSVGPPSQRDWKRGHAGADRLALARLVWHDHTDIIPVTIEWVADDRILVEWRRHHLAEPRTTWLPKADVRSRLPINNH